MADKSVKFTKSAADVIAVTCAQWAAFRRAGGIGRGGGTGDAGGEDLYVVPTAVAGDGPNRWSYTVNLFIGPGVGTPLAEGVLAYNTIERENDGSVASGYTIGEDGVTAVRPAPLGIPFRASGPYIDSDEPAYLFEWPNIPDVECEE